MGDAIDNPTNDVIGDDMHRKISKDMYAALAVDFLRQLMGDGLSDGEVRALLAERLDILHANAIVPRTLPQRFSRHPGVERTA